LLGELFPQRSGLPNFTVLMVEFQDTLKDLLETDGIGIPHRTTSIGGQPIAVEINNVDVRSPQCVAFFQNARTLVDQRIEAAVCDFRDGDLTLYNPRLCGVLRDVILPNSLISAGNKSATAADQDHGYDAIVLSDPTEPF
jgi:hypothetical protein